MRKLTIWWAHLRANALCLRDVFRWNPNYVRYPLQVYTQFSLEPGTGMMTRQVGVGYWAPGIPGKWTTLEVFFKEEYNVEMKVWNQVTPPKKQRQPYPASPTSRSTR